MYVAHSGEARILLGPSTAWKAKAVSTAGHGLAKSEGETLPPRQAITDEQLAQLVLTKCWSDELALIALSSWTFLLRAPFGTPASHGVETGEGQSPDNCLERKAGIGLRTEKWS